MLLIVGKVLPEDLEGHIGQGTQKVRILDIGGQVQRWIYAVTFEKCWDVYEGVGVYDLECGCREFVENIEWIESVLERIVKDLGESVYLAIVTFSPLFLEQSFITVFDVPAYAMWVNLGTDVINPDLELLTCAGFNNVLTSIFLDLPLELTPFREFIREKKDLIASFGLEVSELGSGLMIKRPKKLHHDLCASLEEL